MQVAPGIADDIFSSVGCGAGVDRGCRCRSGCAESEWNEEGECEDEGEACHFSGCERFRLVRWMRGVEERRFENGFWVGIWEDRLALEAEEAGLLASEHMRAVTRLFV